MPQDEKTALKAAKKEKALAKAQAKAAQEAQKKKDGGAGKSKKAAAEEAKVPSSPGSIWSHLAIPTFTFAHTKLSAP